MIKRGETKGREDGKVACISFAYTRKSESKIVKIKRSEKNVGKFVHVKKEAEGTSKS